MVSFLMPSRNSNRSLPYESVATPHLAVRSVTAMSTSSPLKTVYVCFNHTNFNLMYMMMCVYISVHSLGDCHFRCMHVCIYSYGFSVEC